MAKNSVMKTQGHQEERPQKVQKETQKHNRRFNGLRGLEN